MTGKRCRADARTAPRAARRLAYGAPSAEGKARNHALMVAGGLVVSHAPGGDWKRIDWDALAAWLDRYGYKIKECEAEELPTNDATKRLRAWEHKSGGNG